jgi:hypothetical protein
MSITLTATKEVCNFLDDNQFNAGESQDKCGPEALALFWHSTAPNVKNTYIPEDIHNMAHKLYEKFIGPDVSSDVRGTDDATLYKMIEYLGFKYYKCPDVSTDKAYPWIRAWLQNGYPVVMGGISESSIKDTALTGLKSPYAWDTSGLFHIILATGPESPGFIRVRDTANYRPGPRVYETTGLTMTTATMLVPSWLPDPKNATPPVPIKSWQEQVLDHCAAIENLIKAQQ